MSTIDLTPIQKFGTANQFAIYDDETELRAIDNGGFTLYTPTTYTTWESKVFGSGPIRRLRFEFTGLRVSTTDGGANGAGGGVKLLDFPLGQHQVMAITSIQHLDSITADGTGLTASAVLDIGVGTVIADNSQAALATTKQDLIPKDDITLSSGEATNQTIFTASAATVLGTTSAGQKSAFLNVACEAATSNADGYVDLDGFVELTVLVGADY